MNRVIIFVFCTCFSVGSRAQTTAPDRDVENFADKRILLSYLSLSSPIENYNSVDIGIMTTSGKAAGYGAEVGYIYDMEQLNQLIPAQWYSDVYGIKSYLYYRFILEEVERYPANSNSFIDIEAQFYWASFKSERIAGYSCNEQFGDCEYYRFFDSRIDRIIPGLNFKIGKMYQYDPLFITLFIGVGYRYVQESSAIDKLDIKADKFFQTDGQVTEIVIGNMLRWRLGFQLAYNLWH